MLKRRGRYRPEDFSRLRLAKPFDVTAAKTTWLDALVHAETFVRERPADEVGCLYYSASQDTFVTPRADQSLTDQRLVQHFGTPGGVLPRVKD